MSFYATVIGFLKYNSEENFRLALTELNKSSSWNLKVATPHSTETGAEEEWAIKIEEGYYRDITPYLDIPAELASSGMIVGASTDGTFTGWVQRAGGNENEHDLEEWVEENAPDLELTRPSQDEFEDEDEWFENYSSWQSDCTGEFLGEHRTNIQELEENFQGPQNEAAA